MLSILQDWSKNNEISNDLHTNFSVSLLVILQIYTVLPTRIVIIKSNCVAMQINNDL